MERAADFIRLHQGDLRKTHPGRLLTGQLGPLNRMRDVGSALAGHPDADIVAPTVQVAAAAVLLEEGVERGQHLGHGARPTNEHGGGATYGSKPGGQNSSLSTQTSPMVRSNVPVSGLYRSVL